MTRIRLLNIGAIKEVDIEINRINVIIGPQSSGKSTIVKIISFCQWAEKRYILDGEVFLYNIKHQLLDFYHLTEFFDQDSEVLYESKILTISFKYNQSEPTIKVKNKKELEFQNTKNIYIPAERNFASAISNLDEFYKTEDNLKNFLRDWYKAKKVYSSQNTLLPLNLKATYYFDKKRDADYIIVKDKNNKQKEFKLNQASSGLQAIIPLLSLVNNTIDEFSNDGLSLRTENYLTKIINKSFPQLSLQKTTAILGSALLTNSASIKKNESLINEAELAAKDFDESNTEIKKIISNYKDYQFSRLIIEEPEQNLFPSTQRELIYYIIEKIISTKKEHQLFITTHSPYILYAINNCILGYSIKDKMPIDEQSELKSKPAWVNPDLVSIWEIHNGSLRDIKDKETNTINDHYLERSMGELMDEFYKMLNYFE